MLIVALFTAAMDTAQVSLNRWMDKEDVVFAHKGVFAIYNNTAGP